MSVISSVVNFRENLSKNLPYCNLLLGQMTSSPRDIKVCEHAALASCRNVISRICEGYQFVIAFSGVLFNTEPIFSQLSSCGYCFTEQSDAELALFSYIHFGKESPSLLCGHFSYIIYDSMRRRIFAASDRSSSLPLFYAHINDEYLLSSDLQSMFAHPGLSPELTVSGVSHLLSFSCEASESIFNNISSIPPSHFLEISSSGIEKKEYVPQSPNPSPTDMVRKYLSKNPEKIGVCFVGDNQEAELLRLIRENGYNTQIIAYADRHQDIFDEYSVDWQRLSLCEESVMTALEHTVTACGIPYLFGNDFIYSILFRRLCHKNQLIFAPSPKPANTICNYEIFYKNNALHRALAETVVPTDSTSGYTPNLPGILAQSCKIPLAQVFESATPFASGIAKTHLRHILLSIISKDTAPILAFFRSGALLRLCEGRFDFSDTAVSEEDLISYIIKLNIWFEKYHPIIL